MNIIYIYRNHFTLSILIDNVNQLVNLSIANLSTVNLSTYQLANLPIYQLSCQLLVIAIT